MAGILVNDGVGDGGGTRGQWLFVADSDRLLLWQC